MENFVIDYLLLTIDYFFFSSAFTPEIGTARISQGKSAKNEKIELKNAKKANFMEAIRC